MNLSVAPLEGITGYVYRSVHHSFFGGADQYYIPFIEPKPNSKKDFTGRERKDILPENNKGVPVIPQILTNRWDAFVITANRLKEYGYREINLNLGCPSRTVTSKGKGSGFLEYPDRLDEFFYHLFEELDVEISVKTRIGIDEPEEFDKLLRIYEKYPLKELIVHPRTQSDLYKNTPNPEAYEKALERRGKWPVVYNGDIRTLEDFRRISQRFPESSGYMMGRGVLRNPALLRMIRGGRSAERKELKCFYDTLKERYVEELSDPKTAVLKLKEIWMYQINLFEDAQKAEKAIKKARTITEYESALDMVWSECGIKDNA